MEIAQIQHTEFEASVLAPRPGQIWALLAAEDASPLNRLGGPHVRSNRVDASSLLAGLHHEYSLMAAAGCPTICGAQRPAVAPCFGARRNSLPTGHPSVARRRSREALRLACLALLSLCEGAKIEPQSIVKQIEGEGSVNLKVGQTLDKVRRQCERPCSEAEKLALLRKNASNGRESSSMPRRDSRVQSTRLCLDRDPVPSCAVQRLSDLHRPQPQQRRPFQRARGSQHERAPAGKSGAHRLCGERAVAALQVSAQ